MPRAKDNSFGDQAYYNKCLRVFYSDKYSFPLPEGHRFPIEKYRVLREMLVARGILSEEELSEPEIATRDQIILAHSEKYHDDFQNGNVDPSAIRRLGLPWSYELYMRSAYSVGGAIASALSALEDGIAGNLAGGTHHAFRDACEGFCVFNDFAVVTEYLQRNKPLKELQSLISMFIRATAIPQCLEATRMPSSSVCTGRIIIRSRKYLQHLMSVWKTEPVTKFILVC